MKLCSKSVMGAFLFLALVLSTLPAAAQDDLCFGCAWRMAKENQILNPKKVRGNKPVRGLDGQAAEIGVQQYHKSFKQTPSQRSYVIPIGELTTTSAR